MDFQITSQVLISTADQMAAAAAAIGSHGQQGYEKFIEARDTFVRIATMLECTGRLTDAHIDDNHV